MNIKKWKQIWCEEVDKQKYRDISPEGWSDIKGQLVNLIKEIDKATEVYNMENGVKNGN